MSQTDQPLVTKLGGQYYKESQCFLPMGYKSGTTTQTGHSLVLLIGYDREKDSRSEQNIIQCLPVLLYLPNEPTTDIVPENWTGNYIRRVVKERTNWQTLSRTHIVRQFYNRFISEKRKDPKLDVKAQTLLFPMSEDFFESLDFLRVRICGRVSIIYRHKGEEKVHLADAYCLHTIIPDSVNKNKIADEFITPVFISDEDYIYVEPEVTALGKITLKCPLDSPHTITSLSQKTDSKFNLRKVIYEGTDIATFDEVRIEDEPRYLGNDMGYIIKVLTSITSICIKQDIVTQDYFVEQTNPNIKRIDTRDYKTKYYTIPNIDVPYDQTKSKTKKEVKQTLVCSLPYFNNEIRKMFSIKLTEVQRLDLTPADYIMPRI